ncbi:beta-1,6-N-acetylglucosaminyltransferase [Olivibacter sp. CPCC 100613]|uniref:beta-1,6-N-acetylglucosaminyltransferase n=1 Tax=Olivibacter sp. CPCC 100613 TaxID=3079931 RepID=UPI002FF805D2
MVVNYLILAHDNLSQLDKLVHTLNSSYSRFYIHIDRRVQYKEINRRDFVSLKNVVVLKNRVAIHWGGFNMIKATLSLMWKALNGKDIGYYVLLSGQDFPIKSNEIIYDILSKNYGAEFLQYWSIPYKNWIYNGGIGRFRYYWFIDKIGFKDSSTLYQLQVKSGFERRYFEDFPPFGGSQWWCLTHEAVTYVVKFINYNKIILNYFEHTLIPDEIFFHTILLNSPFKDKVFNNNLRYLQLEEDKASPNVLTSSDYQILKESNSLWARKFDERADPHILNQIIVNLL